jgi:hypothetical protein
MLLNLSEGASQQLEDLAKKKGLTYADVVESAIKLLAGVETGEFSLGKAKKQAETLKPPEVHDQAKQQRPRRRRLLDDEP